MQINKAIFAGGCFWCTEAMFTPIKGVNSVVSGYIGGKIQNPTYREVCSGDTGHAEAVQITFDSDIVSYDTLLDIFLLTHDPTQLNRQGHDVGTQYRSSIFTLSEEQRHSAHAAIVRAKEVWLDPVVTEIVPATMFYYGEEYHQNYYANNESQPYCQVIINPKLAKLRQHYGYLMR